jgi:hypothetical protein
MKPEGTKNIEQGSKKEEYTALGITEEWVEQLQALRNTAIEKLKVVEKPGK